MLLLNQKAASSWIQAMEENSLLPAASVTWQG